VRRAVLGAALALPLSIVLVAPGAASAAPEPTPRVAVTLAVGAPAIRGDYIVSLRPGTDAAAVARTLRVRTRYVYRTAVDGFSASLTDRQLARVRARTDVVRVEQDSVVRADATQSNPPYGLDRIDQRTRPLSRTYTYRATGSGVRAYIIDTGIATSHPDFGGRAMNVYDALGGNGQDCNGHGTHVAGTVGGATYGVAKAALLRGVRVLGCNGSGSTSGIIAAVDWVRANALRPAVANMSLGGGASASLDAAVAALADSGIFTAVAAGNESRDACTVSPARARAVFTVAASDSTDARASFSNYGGCVEAYAPGVGVTSAWLSGGTRTISGTSMASPHVAGIAALYKSANGDQSSATVSGWLVGVSTANVISGNPGGTPNRLVFTNGL